MKMKKITYNELKNELKLYKEQIGYRNGLYMHYVPENLDCRVEEVYPVVCDNIYRGNIMGKTKKLLRWRWGEFCRYLCKKYGIDFKDEDDGKQRFILHSDGSYEEVIS